MIGSMKNHVVCSSIKSIFLTVFILLFALPSVAQIPSTGLIAYYPLNGNTDDESGNLQHGTNHGAVLTTDRFGQVDSAYQFNGIDQYIEIPDADEFSIAQTNQLTISLWMRIDVFDYANHENDYVHWFGKGSIGEQEWALRMYNLNSTRPSRTSCYSFNLSGGLGAGSYVQEDVFIGEWIHIVALYNYQSDSIQLYKNGVLKDTDFFSDYSIIPENGTTPVRLGTRDFSSYFEGAIDDVRFYNRVLTASEIHALHQEGDCLVQNVVSNQTIHSDTTIYAQELIVLNNISVYTPYELTLKSPKVHVSTNCDILSGAKVTVMNEAGCGQGN